MTLYLCDPSSRASGKVFFRRAAVMAALFVGGVAALLTVGAALFLVYGLRQA